MRTKLIALFVLLTLGLVACEPEQVMVEVPVEVTRVVTDIVEVTRVITETVIEQGEQVVVTSVVTEVQEVVVTATGGPAEVEVTRIVTATPDPNATAVSITATPEVTGTLEVTNSEVVSGPTFLDNFDTGLSSEWDIQTPSAWASVNGTLTSLGGDSVMALGEGNSTDYLVSLDVVDIRNTSACKLIFQSDKDDNGTLDQEIALVFMFQGSLGSPFPRIFWLKPDSEDELPGTEYRDLEFPYNLKVEVGSNGSLIASVNDQVISSVVMPDYVVGRPALWCEAEGVSLDNFSVTPLSE